MSIPSGRSCLRYTDLLPSSWFLFLAPMTHLISFSFSECFSLVSLYKSLPLHLPSLHLPSITRPQMQTLPFCVSLCISLFYYLFLRLAIVEGLYQYGAYYPTQRGRWSSGDGGARGGQVQCACLLLDC